MFAALVVVLLVALRVLTSLIIFALTLFAESLTVIHLVSPTVWNSLSGWIVTIAILCLPAIAITGLYYHNLMPRLFGAWYLPKHDKTMRGPYLTHAGAERKRHHLRQRNQPIFLPGLLSRQTG